MRQRTDFLDIQDEHDASDDTTVTFALQDVLDNSPSIALKDLKSDMARHESFEDMLGMALAKRAGDCEPPLQLLLSAT